MPEPAEKTLRERRFIKSKGLISDKASIYSSRDKWGAMMQQGGTHRGAAGRRITGLDVQRAGGVVGKARVRASSGAAKPTYQSPKRAGKPQRTAKARFAAIGKALAGKRNLRTKPARITRTR